MASPTPQTLSISGRIFFGSLCAGTFGLGVWQLVRLNEKQELIQQRQHELEQPPMLYDCTKNSTEPYRQRLLSGKFRHEREVLIGPRGAPVGVSVPRQGLSANSKSNATGGAAPGPQGFFVLTPLELSQEHWSKETKTNGGNSNDIDEPTKNTRTVWVNRGWVPKTMVETPRGGRQRPSQIVTTPPNMLNWYRPEGTVQLTSIMSSTEKPKIVTPTHDYSKRPLQLFWFDPIALQAIAESEQEMDLLVQVKSSKDDENNNQSEIIYPLTSPVESLGEFKISPLIHAGYAATWFSLSGAGIYMLRKLITKGH